MTSMKGVPQACLYELGQTEQIMLASIANILYVSPSQSLPIVDMGTVEAEWRLEKHRRRRPLQCGTQLDYKRLSTYGHA